MKLISQRLLQLVLIVFTSVALLGAASSSSRFNELGHKMMCVCGCGQILLECNHVGCPDSDREISELREQLASGASDTAILGWFTNKYGPTVLAAPIRGGFDTAAWIVPFAALALGIVLVVYFLRRWKSRQPVLEAPASATTWPPAVDDEVRERIRRETE
jgi:cytochrome c-type biogenesis protein CcmH